MSYDTYRKCSKCGITPYTDNMKKFYRFPKPGPTNILRCNAWARYCWPEQKFWSTESLMKLHLNHKVLCWRHFEDYCFSGSISSSGKRNLTKYCVPGERQYVIKMMDSLRREMKNQNDNVEKNSDSSGTPVTGCSTQPETIVVTFGVPVHRFPNPEKHPDLFLSWVTIIGKKLEESDPKAVYKNKRICDHHFDPIYKISEGRLKPKSIPSINLYGILPTCTTFIGIDHCYSHPQRESLPPKPLIYVDVSKPCTHTTFNAGVLHVFPNPKKFPDRLRAWVAIVGGKLESASDYDIYKNYRVCDIHFAYEHRNRFKRLNTMAMPTLHLPGRPDCQSEASQGSQSAAPIAGCSQSCDSVPAPVVTGRVSLTRHFDEIPIKNITTAPSYVLAEHTYSVMSRDKVTMSNEGMLNHMNFRVSFQNDHSYDKQVTIVTPASGTSTKKVKVKIDGKTCIAINTHQDGETADAAPSGIDAEDIIKTEDTTDEPSAIDDDFAPSPVPEAEDSGKLFSWQQSELIPADDTEPLTAAELEEKTGISLYCDDTPSQAVPEVPETSIKEVEYRCKDCCGIIDGFQFWCVQCVGCALCGACEARGEHKLHYVLRAPPHRPYKQTQVVLATIRHQLQNENLLTQLGPDDDGVKLEVKEEPPEEDRSVVNPGTRDDPLDADDPLRHEPMPDESRHTTAAEETERPFKRPRLADYIEKDFTTKVKVTSIPKPLKNIRISSDNVADEVEYVMKELKTAKPEPHESIRIKDMDVPVEYVMEELETAKPKPSKNIRINSDKVANKLEYVMMESKTARPKKHHENIRINDTDVPVANVMEELGTARPKPYKNIRINSDKVANKLEYVMMETKTAKPKHHENIRINDTNVPVANVMEELETARAKPHENICNNSDDTDYQVEYLMDEFETDDDTYIIEELETDDGTEFTEIEHLDDEFIDSVDSILVDDFRKNETDTRIVNVNETFVDNRIVGAESILSDLPRRGLRGNIIGYNRLPMRGSPKSMIRSLSSEAVVELEPLSSLEIRKWTADSKIKNK